VAHSRREFRRVTVDSATCLEHLLKACLATRSPALIVDLRRGEQSFSSLVQVLGIADAQPPQNLRTVSLRDALTRMNRFIPPPTSPEDIQTLIDMRDGTIHSGSDGEVEERLVVAFIQYAEALLKDLGRQRDWFWGDQLEVVDALLVASSDKTMRQVRIKLASAAANYQRINSSISFDMQAAVRWFAVNDDPDFDQDIIDCPACGSPVLARGYHWVEWNFEQQDDGRFLRTDGKVWFWAYSIDCRICHLSLTSHAEILAAGLQEKWLVEDADPSEYETSNYDEQADPQRWLEEQRDDKG